MTSNATETATSTARATKKPQPEGAAVKKRPTSRRATSRKATAPAITEAMIAERAYHLSLSGDGGTNEENWHRAEAELRQGAYAL